MPDIDPAKQRDFALDVLRKLREAGYTAYWAGGCVRDQLMGHAPKDYDVATSARPDEIRRLFGRRRTLQIGAAFGVVSVLGPPGAGQVEVATFRQDISYTDGRRPDAIRFSTAEEDAARRDFTINGVFYDPIEDRVIDYVGGREDLRRGVVRAIGDPHERFTEDKLRMLRAVRFAARFGFVLDEATHQAIREMASKISIVSAERIAQEMRGMLTGPRRRGAMEMLWETGLIEPLLPELVPLHGRRHDLYGKPVDLWQFTLAVLDRISDASFALALAAILQFTGLGIDEASDEPSEVASPPDDAAGVQRWIVRSAGIAADVASRWKLSNKEADRVVWLVRHQRSLEGAAARRWSRLQPLLVSPGIDELLQLHADRLALAGQATDDVAYCRAQLQRPAAELDPPPLLSGHDLMELGVPRGEIYRHLLQAVREAQLDGQIGSRGEALAWVNRLLKEQGDAR